MPQSITSSLPDRPPTHAAPQYRTLYCCRGWSLAKRPQPHQARPSSMASHIANTTRHMPQFLLSRSGSSCGKQGVRRRAVGRELSMPARPNPTGTQPNWRADADAERNIGTMRVRSMGRAGNNPSIHPPTLKRTGAHLCALAPRGHNVGRDEPHGQQQQACTGVPGGEGGAGSHVVVGVQEKWRRGMLGSSWVGLVAAAGRCIVHPTAGMHRMASRPGWAMARQGRHLLTGRLTWQYDQVVQQAQHGDEVWDEVQGAQGVGNGQEGEQAGQQAHARVLQASRQGQGAGSKGVSVSRRGADCVCQQHRHVWSQHCTSQQSRMQLARGGLDRHARLQHDLCPLQQQAAATAAAQSAAAVRPPWCALPGHPPGLHSGVPAPLASAS